MGAAGGRKCDFASAILLCIAAFLTARFRDSLKKPRHAKTMKVKRARIPPTTMKTVPDGSEDCCMKGAFEVGGTEGAG